MPSFAAPNYTQVPNDFFDMLGEMEMSELKVTLAVIRGTLGYHTEKFDCSIRSMADATGLSTSSVLEGAEKAEERETIERVKNGQKTTSWRVRFSVALSDTARKKYLARRDTSVAPGATQLGLNKETKGPASAVPASDTANLYTVYEQNISPLTPMIADALKADEADYGAEWVEAAILEATKNNARNLKYIEAILRRWQQEGFKSERSRAGGKKNKQPEDDDDYWLEVHR